MRIFILETILMMFIDVFAIFLSFALAYYFRLFSFSHTLFPFIDYFQMAILIVPLWIVLLVILGRYSLDEKTFLKSFWQIFFASLSSTLLFPLIFYFSNDRFFSRGIIILLFLFSVFSLFFISFLFRKYTKVKASLLIIGANKDAVRIIENLQSSHSRHIPTAIIAPYGAKKKELRGVPVVGKLDALDRVVHQYTIDEIFICEGIEHSENISSFCRNKGIPLKISIETLGMISTSIDPQEMGGTVFLTMQQSPLFGWGQFLKRIFDIIFATIGLIIFSPLWLWYRKNMKKIIFQKNTTQTFEAFVIIKNNTFCFLKWTLLWNVLTKDISIVGPRLFTKEEYLDFFQNKIAGVEARTVLRNGIFSSSSYSHSLEEVLTLDIKYIQNWSFGNDLQIILTCVNNFKIIKAI